MKRTSITCTLDVRKTILLKLVMTSFEVWIFYIETSTVIHIERN